MVDFFETLRSALPYVYFCIISVIAVIVTVYDKYAAKKRPGERVPEKKLFFVAFLGGAIFMLATMLIIRHKTLHKRFMIGLPAIIAAHFALIIALLTIL